MKKLLLATTMLAGSAGFAAAEISVTGSAEMGIWLNNEFTGTAPAGEDGVAFWQDIEVVFEGSGTTDGGLEFGAKIDLDEGNVALNDDSGTTVWISGAFGTLTMGDTDGALDWALADMDNGMTSIADDHTTHTAWFGGQDMDGSGDGQILRYNNTFGAFGVAVSLEQGDNGIGAVDDIFGLGFKYTATLGGTDVNFGLGYQDAGDEGSAVGLSAAATFGGSFTGKIGYISFDSMTAGFGNVGQGVPAGLELDSHLGAELTYVSGPVGVGINYGVVDFTDGTDMDSWGVVANYDLGGGAKVEFGYASDVSVDPTVDNDQWSLGIGMSF